MSDHTYSDWYKQSIRYLDPRLRLILCGEFLAIIYLLRYDHSMNEFGQWVLVNSTSVAMLILLAAGIAIAEICADRTA